MIISFADDGDNGDEVPFVRTQSTRRSRGPVMAAKKETKDVPFVCTQSTRRSLGPVMAAKKETKGTKQRDGKYKHTVDLPKTTFGMRANSSLLEGSAAIPFAGGNEPEEVHSNHVASSVTNGKLLIMDKSTRRSRGPVMAAKKEAKDVPFVRTQSTRRSHGRMMAAKKNPKEQSNEIESTSILLIFIRQLLVCEQIHSVREPELQKSWKISLAVIRSDPIITYDITDMRTKQRDGKYKHTVDLVKTTFGMRANSCVREQNQKLWDENQVREEPLSATFVAVEKFTEEAGIFSGCYVIGDGNPGIGHLDELSSIVMIEPYSDKYRSESEADTQGHLNLKISVEKVPESDSS
ncbi:hypothetical protein Tco_0488996 [Tanacetum coccineum]